MQSYRRERAGKKKPFFNGKLGLEGAIAIACNNRINGFRKKAISRRIDMNSAIDEYTVSVQGDSIDIANYRWMLPGRKTYQAGLASR